MKKAISTIAIGLVLAAALPAFAASNTGSISGAPGTTMQKSAAMSACVKTAAQTRNSSLAAAKQSYTGAAKTARDSRTAAVKAAKGGKTAIAAANVAYKAAVVQAKNTYTAAQKAASAQYKSDVAACKK